MTLEDVLKHFGTAYKVSKELGISTGTPYHWRKLGYIPIETQLMIEAKTEGKLKASLNDLGEA